MFNSRLPQTWDVHLDAWVLSDGNYPDFQIGQIAEFALEFWLPETPRTESQEAISLDRCGDCLYKATADVVIEEAALTVIDFGIQAFSQRSLASKGLEQGRRLSMSVGLGVDPYFYFEAFSGLPGVPPLIYSWRIASIVGYSAPYVESVGADGRKVISRDDNRLTHRQIDGTDAWHDDGWFQYTLQCELLPIAPKRTSSTAIYLAIAKPE